MSTALMGIVNLTPDSFSDGGRFLPTPSRSSSQSLESLWLHIQPWIDAHIPWIDLGAESTRPGAKPIDADTEWQRLQPALDFLHRQDLKHTQLSIDSRHPTTQIKALSYPQVAMINCVHGTHPNTHLPQLLQARPNLKFLAMHMHTHSPQTMQDQPLDAHNVIKHVEDFFHRAYHDLLSAGFLPHNIILDPGIGFGKTIRANLQLILHAAHWSRLWPAIAYGISRKSFIGTLSHIPHPQDRDAASKPLESLLIQSGVSYLRTHQPLSSP